MSPQLLKNLPLATVLDHIEVAYAGSSAVARIRCLRNCAAAFSDISPL
ncbi:hypothetical protein [Methanosarcina horonobensis]|nr:hypothetical protein [Methanosarcina horonobensis]